MYTSYGPVSISESRCFSFQEYIRLESYPARDIVSISESRCFSFQGMRLIFDAVVYRPVSISESRCFSFQEKKAGAMAHSGHGFNLGIEMLFVSRIVEVDVSVTADEFQSRNRDAFRFKWDNQGCLSWELFVSISESRCFSFQANG